MVTVAATLAAYAALWAMVNAVVMLIDHMIITLGIFWALWATITAGVMVVDRIRSNESFGAISTYFVLAVTAPFLALPVYFFSSHRKSTTATRCGLTIAGVPLTCVAFVLACYQFIVIVNIIHDAFTN